MDWEKTRGGMEILFSRFLSLVSFSSSPPSALSSPTLLVPRLTPFLRPFALRSMTQTAIASGESSTAAARARCLNASSVMEARDDLLPLFPSSLSLARSLIPEMEGGIGAHASPTASSSSYWFCFGGGRSASVGSGSFVLEGGE